jgi:hypothetical protein
MHLYEYVVYLQYKIILDLVWDTDWIPIEKDTLTPRGALTEKKRF